MKSLYFLLFIILIIPSVSATVLLDEWKYNYDTFTIDEDIYSIYAYDNYSKIRVRVNGLENYVVDFGKCTRNGLKEYCFNGTDWDERLGINKYDQVEPALHLKFNELEPDITITRAFSVAPMEFGETSVVTVTIANKGTKEAGNVSYTDLVPSNMQIITASENVIIYGNKIMWSFGRITPGNEKTFTYTVKAIEYKDKENTALATYTYEGIASNTTSSKALFDVKTPYDLTTAASTTTPNINTVFTYTITYKNNELEKDIENYFVIQIPEELAILTAPLGLRKEGKKYFYEEPLPAQQEKTMTFRLQGPYTGTYNVTTTANINVNEKQFFEKINTGVKIQTSKISPEILFDVENIRAGEPFKVFVNLYNNDDKNSYVAIQASLVSELFNEAISIDSIAPGNSYSLNKRYYTPLSDTEKSIVVNITGTFKSLNGETFSLHTQKTLRIAPINQSLSIEQSVSKTEVKKGENITVSVTVTNHKDDSLFNVQVDDYFPQELVLIQGKPSVLISSLRGNEKKEAYVYKLQIPEQYSSDKVTIISKFSSILQGQEYSKTIETVIAVANATLAEGNTTENQTQNQTAQENAENNTGIPENKKDGFFTTFWNDIKSFFSDLFG
ncbi:DUF11 domain-containing protein [Candidatus Woesearchaeota archaeon]|nr:MAG: DUF11 domain-containing protein [Candidatus Woesearchaeota archaeon]